MTYFFVKIALIGPMFFDAPLFDLAFLQHGSKATLNICLAPLAAHMIEKLAGGRRAVLFQKELDLITVRRNFHFSGSPS
jgi:hypothetical protein